MSVSKVSITHSCTYGKFSITWYQVKKSGVTTTIPEVDLMKSQWYNKEDLGNFLKTVSVLMVLNSLTYSQRNWDLTLLSFESALDNHLKTIPDKPQIIGYTSHRRADTNSLLYMANLAGSFAGLHPFQNHHNKRGELNNQQAWGIYLK